MSDNERRETHAAVIAEMRIFKCRNLETGELEPCNAVANYFADRLEAAHEREIAASGNAAALREALRRLRDATRNFYNQILNSGYSKILDKYTCIEQGFPAVLDVRDAIPLANTALAAPPRNCDRPECKDYNSAWDEWDKDCKKHRGKDGYCEGCPHHKATGRCFVYWLFALATEPEGGAE